MNSRISGQQFKGLLFVQSLFALVLAAPEVAFAINIKDTNYPIPSGAYFVSPNGKDSNSGKTPDSPWPVAKALKSAPRESTIVFRGGTYRNISANINKKLTLQAYPHEKPWLKGSVKVKNWVADGGRWRSDGWNYSFPIKEQGRAINSKYPMAGRTDMVYLNGVSLKQVASKAQVKRGTFYVDHAKKKLYIGNNPAGKTVEATALKRGFNLWQGRGANPRGTMVRGLGFAHYANQGIEVQAPQVRLEDNTFVWNGIQGVALWGQGKSPDAIVRGNTFSYNGRVGLEVNSADRMLLENNTFTYNNVESFAITWSAAGVKVTKTNRLLWRNNRVAHNFATGMWLDDSTTNATVVKNTVQSNSSIGIQFELSHKAIVAGNVVANNGAGIMIADSSDIRVYNNTLSMNKQHIIVKDSTRKNTKAAEVGHGIAWVTRNNVFKNNILSNATGSTLIEAVECSGRQHSNQMITDSDYNGYYRKSSSKPKNIIKWSLGKGKCLVGYGSIATFESATGFEANALVVDNVQSNPFFVDEASGDFRLKAGSSAIGRGEALPTDIATAIGLLPGVSVDLGALQSKVVLE